jgi:hypothetical protein
MSAMPDMNCRELQGDARASGEFHLPEGECLNAAQMVRAALMLTILPTAPESGQPILTTKQEVPPRALPQIPPSENALGSFLVTALARFNDMDVHSSLDQRVPFPILACTSHKLSQS